MTPHEDGVRLAKPAFAIQRMLFAPLADRAGPRLAEPLSSAQHRSFADEASCQLSEVVT